MITDLSALERVAKHGDPFEFLGATYVYAKKGEIIKGDFNKDYDFAANESMVFQVHAVYQGDKLKEYRPIGLVKLDDFTDYLTESVLKRYDDKAIEEAVTLTVSNCVLTQHIREGAGKKAMRF